MRIDIMRIDISKGDMAMWLYIGFVRCRRKALDLSEKLAAPWKREEGMGTVEIVIIIAVLVGLALIFRDAIIDFATGVMSALFANDQLNQDVDVNNIRNIGVGG